MVDGANFEGIVQELFCGQTCAWSYENALPEMLILMMSSQI